MLLEFVTRAVARTRTCLPAVRFSSTLRGDQENLRDILEDADRSQATEWIEPGAKRAFRVGLSIRPHFFTYKHRFMMKTKKPAPPLVAPTRKQALQNDVLREFGIDPLWETSNPALFSYFLTDMSKIKPRTATGLTTKTQRRLAKAIRRAKMMGTIPLFYNPRLLNRKEQGP